jgi:hypothetical protein
MKFGNRMKNAQVDRKPMLKVVARDLWGEKPHFQRCQRVWIRPVGLLSLFKSEGYLLPPDSTELRPGQRLDRVPDGALPLGDMILLLKMKALVDSDVTVYSVRWQDYGSSGLVVGFRKDEKFIQKMKEFNVLEHLQNSDYDPIQLEPYGELRSIPRKGASTPTPIEDEITLQFAGKKGRADLNWTFNFLQTAIRLKAQAAASQFVSERETI